MRVRGAMARTLLGAAVVATLSLAAVTTLAQGRGFGGFGGPRVRNFKAYPNTPYDGRFNFMRFCSAIG